MWQQAIRKALSCPLLNWRELHMNISQEWKHGQGSHLAQAAGASRRCLADLKGYGIHGKPCLRIGEGQLSEDHTCSLRLPQKPI